MKPETKETIARMAEMRKRCEAVPKGVWKYQNSVGGRPQVSGPSGRQICLMWRDADTDAKGRFIAAVSIDLPDTLSAIDELLGVVRECNRLSKLVGDDGTIKCAIRGLTKLYSEPGI